MDRLSPLIETVYRDILRMLKDDRALMIRGAPTLNKRGNRHYWYDQYRVGSTSHQAYIGEDMLELRNAIEQYQQLKTLQTARQSERVRMVRLLRTEGLLGLEASSASLLSAMAQSGLFRLGGTLIGTSAFRLYESELAVRISRDQLALTRDIDIASFTQLSLSIGDTAIPPLEKVFKDFEFEAVLSLNRKSVWKWRQTRTDLLVEFLTPSFSEDEGLKDLPALGVSAQSLHHLNYLIANPIHAVIPYRSGVLIQIPAPERFAIHKLIVADRRRDGPDSFKARKDRDQARFLVNVLAEDRPDELAEAYHDAMARGPKWQARIEASLKRLPDVRGRLNTLH